MSATCDITHDAEHSGALVPIASETLCPTMALDFDLYLWANDKSSAVLYREHGFPLTRDDIDRLVEAGVPTVHVPLADHVLYRRYVQGTVAENEKVSPVQRYRILRQLTRSVFDSALRGRNLNCLVQFATTHSFHLADIICDRDLVLSDLFSLMDHDYYTYTHATNVCIYCLALADGLGISDPEDLVAIGTGALLHDVGKRRIPSAILNKRGKLDKDEWDLIQEHPRKGFDEVAARGDLSWAQLMMIYQHHERLDGNGYPVGLKGEEIHEWARICAIADVFDALTSERAYRKPDSTDKVLEYMGKMAGKAFDAEMVACWMAIMSRHRQTHGTGILPVIGQHGQDARATEAVVE